MAKKKEQPVDPERQELVDTLALHYRLKTEAEEAKEEADRIRDSIIVPLFRKLGLSTLRFRHKGYEVTATLPAASDRVDYDEARLRGLIGAKEFEKVTTPKLDARKLDAWLKDSTITDTERMARTMAVAQAVSRKPGPKPSPRYKQGAYLGEAEPVEDTQPTIPSGTVRGVVITLPDLPESA